MKAALGLPDFDARELQGTWKLVCKFCEETRANCAPGTSNRVNRGIVTSTKAAKRHLASCHRTSGNPERNCSHDDQALSGQQHRGGPAPPNTAGCAVVVDSQAHVATGSEPGGVLLQVDQNAYAREPSGGHGSCAPTTGSSAHAQSNSATAADSAGPAPKSPVSQSIDNVAATVDSQPSYAYSTSEDERVRDDAGRADEDSIDGPIASDGEGAFCSGVPQYGLESDTESQGDYSDDSDSRLGPLPRMPRKQSGAWLRSRRLEPLATNHERSVLQAAYNQVEMKKHGASNTVLEMIAEENYGLLSGFKGEHKPHEILLPHSMHMVKQVLGTEDAAKYEFGWCSECAMRFEVDPDKATKTREQLLQETCPRCGHLKYEVCPLILLIRTSCLLCCHDYECIHQSHILMCLVLMFPVHYPIMVSRGDCEFHPICICNSCAFVLPYIICFLLVQAASARTVKFNRRGWDFTMEAVIKWFHEDEAFREAVLAAHPLDFTDADGVAGSLYLNMLNEDCKNVLSKRTDAFGAGIYGMGVIMLEFVPHCGCQTVWGIIMQHFNALEPVASCMPSIHISTMYSTCGRTA